MNYRSICPTVICTRLICTRRLLLTPVVVTHSTPVAVTPHPHGGYSLHPRGGYSSPPWRLLTPVAVTHSTPVAVTPYIYLSISHTLSLTLTLILTLTQGLIFACFMVSVMVGSLVFNSVTQTSTSMIPFIIVHPSNTLIDPPGSTVLTSRLHKANSVMSHSTLRKRFSVMSCQLARL